MAATPYAATISFLVEVEDYSGQHANIRINQEYAPAANTAPDAYFGLTAGAIIGAAFDPGVGSDLVSAVAALTNAKIVKVGFICSADWAAEPASESGKNPLVQSKARLLFEDGKGGKEFLSIPAPVDGLFLTTPGMQSVVNPALSLGGGGGIIGALQTAVIQGAPLTRGGGTWGSLFMGGQLVQGKPPRRRRLQGQ